MDVNLWGKAIIRQAWVIGLALVIGLAVAMMLSRKGGMYFAQSQVLLVNPDASQFQAVSDTAHISVRTEDLPALAQSTAVLTPVAHAIGYTGDPEDLRVRMKVRLAQGSSIMPITFGAASAQEAITGANAIADSLTSYERTVTTSRFENLISDLRGQLKERQHRLARLDRALADVSAKNPLAEQRDGTRPAATALLSLKAKQIDAAAALQGDSQIANGLAQLIQRMQPLANQEVGNSDQYYAELQTQFTTDAARLAHLQSQFSKSYPGLPELVHQQSLETARLAKVKNEALKRSPFFSKSYAAVYAEKAAADSKVASDNAQTAAYADQINELQAEGVAGVSDVALLARLRRERDAEDAGYALVASRLASALADRSQAAALSSIAVIDRPHSAPRASWSTTRLIGIAFFVMATLAGFAIAYLLELYDNRLDTPKKIADLYGAPVFEQAGLA